MRTESEKGGSAIRVPSSSAASLDHSQYDISRPAGQSLLAASTPGLQVGTLSSEKFLDDSGTEGVTRHSHD